MSSTKTRGTRDELYPFDNIIVKVHRSGAGLAWRWRTELLILGGFLAALAWLSGQITITWAPVVLAAALGIIFPIPAIRRFIIRRFWCVLARHRFQRLCWEARLHTRAGRLPVVVWTRPTKVGERLHIWCRAGVASKDFEQHTDELAAACYAREARVTRNRRWSQLVAIDIIRRDTLAAKHQVGSPLTRLEAIYANVLEARPLLSDPADDGPRPWPQASTDPHDPQSPEQAA
jgi:hypothetical protein